MDIDKLTEARNKFIRDNRTLIGNNGPLIADAFDECAEWLMQQPLSERLTEEEKEKIRKLQGEIFKEIMEAHDAEDWQSVAHYILDVMPRTFASIFGSDLFKDK